MSHYLRVLLGGGSVKPATLEEFLRAESGHRSNPHVEAFLTFEDKSHLTIRKDRETNELIILVSSASDSAGPDSTEKEPAE